MICGGNGSTYHNCASQGVQFYRWNGRGTIYCLCPRAHEAAQQLATVEGVDHLVPVEMESGADISPCGTWRYTLTRQWDASKGVVVFVLLNPSKADAKIDDNTLRRGIAFAKRWGYGAVVFVNLFAFRSTDPKNLSYNRDGMVGPGNDEHILQWALAADRIVLAWGNHGTHLDRNQEVLALLEGHDLYCLGLTKTGQPKHPLRLHGSTPLRRFSAVAVDPALEGFL